MRKRHVRNRLDFLHLEYSKIGLPLVESIQRIMIRAEIFGQTLPANRSMEHRAQLGRKQRAVLSSPQHVMEMQQCGRLQNDGGAENACRAHEKGAQTGADTTPGAQ